MEKSVSKAMAVKTGLVAAALLALSATSALAEETMTRPGLYAGFAGGGKESLQLDWMLAAAPHSFLPLLPFCRQPKHPELADGFWMKTYP